MGELLSAAAWSRHFALIFFSYCFFQSTLPGLNHKKQMSRWCETDLTSLFCMFKCPTGREQHFREISSLLSLRGSSQLQGNLSPGTLFHGFTKDACSKLKISAGRKAPAV